MAQSGCDKSVIAAALGISEPEVSRLKSERVPVLMEELALSASAACRMARIHISTFSDWCAKDAELARRYARARSIMLDAKADELEEIGVLAAQSAPEYVQGLRLQSDNRKWYLSKLAPKRYGERVEIAGDNDNPLQVLVSQMSSRLPVAQRVTETLPAPADPLPAPADAPVAPPRLT